MSPMKTIKLKNQIGNGLAAIAVVAISAGVQGAGLLSSAQAAPPTTQLDINQQADASFQQADAALNRVYQQIRRQYRDQPRFLEKLKAAQLAWIRFRDAELQALYPPTADGDPSISYGSMYPTCYASAMERLTRERTAQLRTWLDAVPEGDVCTGSRR